MRILRRLFALMRGAIVTVFLKLFHMRHTKFGKMLCVYSGASLRITGKATLKIGKNVVIGKDSVVSTLKNGELEIGNNVSLGNNNMVV